MNGKSVHNTFVTDKGFESGERFSFMSDDYFYGDVVSIKRMRDSKYRDCIEFTIYEVYKHIKLRVVPDDKNMHKFLKDNTFEALKIVMPISVVSAVIKDIGGFMGADSYESLTIYNLAMIVFFTGSNLKDGAVIPSANAIINVKIEQETLGLKDVVLPAEVKKEKMLAVRFYRFTLSNGSNKVENLASPRGTPFK